MQKILILVCEPAEGTAATERYSRYAQPDQHVTICQLDRFFVAWDGQALHINDSRGDVHLLDFNIVHFAGWKKKADIAYAIARYLADNDVPFVGHTILDIYPDSKLGEMIDLVRRDVAYVKSFYTQNAANMPALYAWAHQAYGLSFPVIIKGTTASLGEDNHFVRDQAALDVLELRTDISYLLQEAVRNDSDYRVVVLGGKAQVIIERVRVDKHSHLNNISQGASAHMIALGVAPRGMTELAERAAEALGRQDIAGVDVLIDSVSGTQYVLEVNRTPHMSLGDNDAIEIKLRALFAHIAKM